MEWIVNVTGDQFDLENLAKSLNTPQATLSQVQGKFVFKSTELNNLSDAASVRKRASELLSMITGGARLTLGTHKPLEVAYVTKTDDDGKGNIIFDIVATVTVRPSLTVIAKGPDGAILGERPSDSITHWLSLANSDKNVATVLQLLGASDDWVNLNRVYEVVVDDVGRGHDIWKKGVASRDALKRFTTTVNSPAVLGIEARHGVQTQAPPEYPMSFGEAKTLIQGIVHAWLESKIVEGV